MHLFHLRFLLCLFAACFAFLSTDAQQTDEDLYNQLRAKDSMLFDVGFNTCDIRQFEQLVSEDFEFYHDKAGITTTKAAFISDIKNGLCKLPYKPRRELKQGSMEVFPMRKNGKLYGAVQTGIHSFYARGKKQTGLPDKHRPVYPCMVAG